VTARRAVFLLTAALCLLGYGEAEAAPFGSAGEISAALDGLAGADLVVLADPGHRPPKLRLATRVGVSFDRVRSMLLDLAAYRSALPGLRRLEFAKGQVGRPGEGMVDWELEVPLWNLDGKLWLQPTPTGVDLILMEGDFSPGLVRFSATPETAGTTLLVMDASANVRDANWITRKMVKRSALAEPGLAAAAFYAMLRALRLQAESLGTGPDQRRQPQAAPSPPALSELEGGRLGRLTGVAAPALVAAVRSQGNGRLALVQVLAVSRLAVGAAADLARQPQFWQALPGWRQVSAAQIPGDCSRTPCWKVEGGFPFLDLGATWKIAPRPFRAVALTGDCQGAVMGLDLLPAAGATATVLSLYPRLEKAGYVPRKSIASEPLLEHGLALGMALVDAINLVHALDANAH
jgi:hypothetical protein